MNEQAQRIYNLLNDFAVKVNIENSLVYEHLELLMNISFEVMDAYDKLNLEELTDFGSEEFSHISLLEKIDLIEQFYQEHQIDFDLNKTISDGTIDFKYIDYLEDNPFEEQYEFGHGQNLYDEKNHRIIDVCSSDTIMDVAVAIHEISHYCDQNEEGRSQINSLFTETLAYIEELILCDDLKDTVYHDDITKIIISNFYAWKTYATENTFFYQLLLLFRDYGNLSEDSYKEYLDTTDGYQDLLDSFDILTEDGIGLEYQTGYLLAGFIVPYLYNKYKENPEFIETIKALHEKISELSIKDILKIIGLTGEIEDYDTLAKNLNIFVDNFQKEYLLPSVKKREKSS